MCSYLVASPDIGMAKNSAYHTSLSVTMIGVVGGWPLSAASSCWRRKFSLIADAICPQVVQRGSPVSGIAVLQKSVVLHIQGKTRVMCVGETVGR